MKGETHILIPIKDIENQIKNLTNTKIEKEINNVRIVILQNILKGKEISLTEDNIIKHIEWLNYKDVSIEAINGFKNGYKQALKDLL